MRPHSPLITIFPANETKDIVNEDYNFLRQLPLIPLSSRDEMQVIGCFLDWKYRADRQMVDCWCRIVRPIPEALRPSIIESLRLFFLLAGEGASEGDHGDAFHRIGDL
jgi:hypothetical protein